MELLLSFLLVIASCDNPPATEAAHLECGFRVAYVTTKACKRFGGYIVKPEGGGKPFCSYLPFDKDGK
jgi:hypothetical protein